MGARRLGRSFQGERNVEYLLISGLVPYSVLSVLQEKSLGFALAARLLWVSKLY